jgi:uncharacterized phage-like protein YoqJ
MWDKEIEIAVTGHRPNKIGGYNNELRDSCIKANMRSVIRDIQAVRGLTDLYAYKVKLISGMALGIDTLWAEVGLELEIPVIAAVPCVGQEKVWPKPSQEKYRKLLDQCVEVVYVDNRYSAAAMQKRNEWMVDKCDILVAYWNGTPGGTRNCVNYASKAGRKTMIINPDELWTKVASLY